MVYVYTFKVNQSQREAIYSGACHSPNTQNLNATEAKALMGITRSKGDTITLTDVQVSTVLAGLNAAIDAQSTDMGDWLRAQEYTQARDYLITETRKQFRIIETQKISVPKASSAIHLVHSVD